MGICPQKFGPYFWGAMHLACLYADDYETLKKFVESYVEMLPCPACRIHFAEVIHYHPFPAESHNLDYFKWSVDAHNIVNSRLGKTQWSYDEAFREWTSGCDGDYDKHEDLKIRTGLVIILILVAVLFFRLRK